MKPGELADFLKRHREALKVSDLGLPRTSRRRTPGLRREEVAAAAGISTDFYVRLEQKRGGAPSRDTVEALSRALKLSTVQRSHLYGLAGYVAPPSACQTDHASPELLLVLGRIDAPAQIVTELGVTLKQNEMAIALVGVQTNYSGLSRSIIYRWFTDPKQRAIYDSNDHDSHSHSYVASLRAVRGRSDDHPEADELIGALLTVSDEFATLWLMHEVADRGSTRKRFVNALVGSLTLECIVLTAKNQTEHLVVFTADPNSQDAAQLEMLRVRSRTPVPASCHALSEERM